MTDYTQNYFREVAEVARGIDQAEVDRMIDVLVDARTRGGRLFILGVGGSAGNAGHAVNDFRKLCGIEAYAPTDNVSELTARVNDDGWATSFANWLRGSRIDADDVVLVFSVGGGNAEKNISANIVEALKLAKSAGARVIGVVGRDGGYTKQVADACVVVPTVNPAAVTPHTEAFQAVVWHGMVTPPKTDRQRDEMGIGAMSRPAIFLDRDGVLVEEIFYAHTGEREAPLSAEDVRLLPGVAAALRALADAGFALVVISNQGAYAKGKTTLRALWLAHERFVALLAEQGVRLDGCYYS